MIAPARVLPVTHLEDTIAAIATPPGTSGIAVIRVSGTRALDASAGVFHGADLAAAASHTAHAGAVLARNGALLDEVLATVFHAPRSYTGEDSVEFGCHGGFVVSHSVLSRILEDGVRQAQPGEFTRRAFLNGRIDLAQAEAVADLIHAQSEDAQQAAVRQLHGALSDVVGGLRERLVRCASLLELSLDFADEDVELLPRDMLRTELESARTEAAVVLASHRSGRVLRDGYKVALAGRPNAGKSSLLNALLGTDRAIVTSVPGTTRDYIEESAMLGGALLRFVDTAGLRSSGDEVERIGIRLSEEHMRTADCVCHVIDCTLGDPVALVDEHRALHAAHTGGGVSAVFALNKLDAADAHVRERAARSGADVYPLSAETREGLGALVARLAEDARTAARSSEPGRVVLTNARHAECLRRCVEGIDSALAALDEGRTEEFLAFDIRRSIDAAGEIIGLVTTDDVLDAIFSRFCIGK